MLDRLVAEIRLNGAGIDPLICQLIAAGVSEHVRVYLHVKSRSLAGTFKHCLKAPSREGRATFADEDERRSNRFAVQPPQGA